MQRTGDRRAQGHALDDDRAATEQRHTEAMHALEATHAPRSGNGMTPRVTRSPRARDGIAETTAGWLIGHEAVELARACPAPARFRGGSSLRTTGYLAGAPFPASWTRV